MEREIEFYVLLCHDTNLFPRKKHPPVVLFLSSILPAQSASLYLARLELVSLVYQIPSLTIPLTKRMIHLTAAKCDSFRFAWYLAHTPILKHISSLLAVK